MKGCSRLGRASSHAGQAHRPELRRIGVRDWLINRVPPPRDAQLLDIIAGNVRKRDVSGSYESRPLIRSPAFFLLEEFVAVPQLVQLDIEVWPIELTRAYPTSAVSTFSRFKIIWTI
jgi:hypothetical protein